MVFNMEKSLEINAAFEASDVIMLITYVYWHCFSFLCSVAEAVLLSITPSYIEGLKERTLNVQLFYKC